MRIEHELGTMTQEDARARLGALGDYFQNKHGMQVTWTGDRATVKGRYLVVSVEGTLSFAGNKVVFEGKDPGMLWRGKAKEYLSRKIGRYLDPGAPLASLPRG